MRDITVSVIAASFHGNKGAAAMLRSSLSQLHSLYGAALSVNLMTVHPKEDRALKPFDYVRVVSCTAEQLVFLAFPLAILYWLFRWLPPARKVLGKHRIIKAYLETDLVLDLFGVSFVDSRGFVMNTYTFISNAVPLLLGCPIIKYSQAIGEFRSSINRLYAKIILPKVKLICARGLVTELLLRELGITDNVVLCADGAFSMPDDDAVTQAVAELWQREGLDAANTIALSLSSVVNSKCQALGIDYPGVMAAFIDKLASRGFTVLLIANAARAGSEKVRNNDIHICNTVYGLVTHKSHVYWDDKEMRPEEIQEMIGHCRLLIASRFHAMIFALKKGVPTLIVGWSHKYKEVLDMFELGDCAVDFSGLSTDMLLQRFDDMLQGEADMRAAIQSHLPAVIESSRENIRLTAQYIDEHLLTKESRGKLFHYAHPEQYLGELQCCRMGYATDETLRENSASGGMVTALLCHLLETGQIDGAWVSRSAIENGQLGYKSFIATTTEEIKGSSTSIYMHMPLLKQVDMLRAFPGRVAVVLLPCQTRALASLLEKDTALAEKVALRISLYCSGAHDKMATLMPLKKLGIPLENATRFIYRRGHWRGTSYVQYQNGTERAFSYTKALLPYKNAYFFAQRSCMVCQDHFGRASDLSFGDIWLKEMQRNPIKHTACIVRTERGRALYQSAVDAGVLWDTHLSQNKSIKSQKRALVFKFHCAQAKVDYFARQGKALQLNTGNRCRWNHRLAYTLARRNMAYSEQHPQRLEKIPMKLLYVYMLGIRVLLNF